MSLQDLIGKVFQIQIIQKNGQWYTAKITGKEEYVYIEDVEYFEKEELLNTMQRCIILDVKEGKLIGFILTNRKFVNDINKISKKVKNLKIKDIYLVERLKINGRVAGLYLVDEGDISKYYLDTTEIGTYVKKQKDNNILFKENTVENELAKQLKDVVQSIDLNKKEISLREEQEKQKHLIEKAIGLELGREITRIATVELSQKVEETQQKNNKKIEQEIQRYKSLEKKKESTIKDVNIKQEMDTKDKLTDMKTLGQLLEKEGKLPQVKGKQFEKIGIIESDQKDNLIKENGEKEKADTTRYSMVAISKDGTVVPLDIEKDHAEGNNPREQNYQVKQNGKVEQDDVLSRFKIGEGTFAVKNGKYGEIKVYHSPRKTIGGKDVEGNKSLDRELETDNVWEIKKEERDLAGEYEDGYRSVEEGYQEAKSHEDNTGRIIDDDKMEAKDIDGEMNTRSHVHDKIDYNQLAVKWGYYREGEPNADKAKELFEEKRKENPKKETKEIIEMVTEELEDELGNNRNSRY